MKGDGSRGSWIGEQKFSADNGGEVLHLDANTMEFARAQILKTREKQIAKSHKLQDQTPKSKLRGDGTMINFSQTNMEGVNSQFTSIMADEQTYKANLRRMIAEEARLARKREGTATFDDLRAEYNSRRE